MKARLDVKILLASYKTVNEHRTKRAQIVGDMILACGLRDWTGAKKARHQGSELRTKVEDWQCMESSGLTKTETCSQS